MSGSGQEDHPDVREWSGVVGRPSRMSGSGQEWSEGTPGCLGVVGRPPVFPGVVKNGGEALLDVQEWSGGPPGCPGVVGKPFRMYGSGLEALPDVQE